MDLQDCPPLPGKAAPSWSAACSPQQPPCSVRAYTARRLQPASEDANTGNRRIRGRRQEGKESRRLLEAFTNLIHPLMKVSRESSIQMCVLTL